MTKPNMFLLMTFFLVFSACRKDNINDDTTNTKEISTPTPLTDFGAATYRGFHGGLYPNGSNERPSSHNAAGVAIAQSIKPLNNTGAVDEANGKTVWISIGMSNTTQETQAFLTLMQTLPNKTRS